MGEPVCEGASSGEIRPGYSIAYLQSEGAAVSEASLLTVLGDWLTKAEFGWNLAAVGCGLAYPMTLTCDERFGVVFTDGAGSFLMEFVVEQKPKPAIELFVHGIASINQQLVAGGHSDLPLRFNFEDRNGTDYFSVSSAPPAPPR